MNTQTRPNPQSNSTSRVMLSGTPARGMNVYELMERHPLVRFVRAGEPPLDESNQRLSLADVHMHTNFSDGTGTVAEVLEHVAQATPLDVISITDHDTIEGALRAREIAVRRNYDFEVIVGEEISTREGHLLALFVEQRVPPGLSIERSIELVHAQGGLAIIAHPFNRIFRHSVQRGVIDRILRQPDVHPDGIESLNGSFAGIGSSRIAMRLARTRYPWPEIGGSDAHTPTAIGSAHTLFLGSGAKGLREALAHGETAPQGSYWQPHEYLVIVSHHVAFGRASMYTGVYTKHKEQRTMRAARLREAAFGWSARAARELATRRAIGEESFLAEEIA